MNPGNLIVLHTMWNNQPITVVYVHLQQNSLKVGAGDEVKEGQLLATSGNSGDTTGPHLHIQASYGHLELQDYYGAYKGPFIEPVSQIWAGAGDPSGVTGDGHPNGSVGGDNASTGTVDTENQLRQEGDFSKVKRLLTRETILSGVEFNPPTPVSYRDAGWSPGDALTVTEIQWGGSSVTLALGITGAALQHRPLLGMQTPCRLPPMGPRTATAGTGWGPNRSTECASTTTPNKQGSRTRQPWGLTPSSCSGPWQQVMLPWPHRGWVVHRGSRPAGRRTCSVHKRRG